MSRQLGFVGAPYGEVPKHFGEDPLTYNTIDGGIYLT